GRWALAGDVEWSTEQSFSPSHSVKLFNTTGWQYFANRASTIISGVPQSSKVEVSWRVKYTVLPGANQHYLMTFRYTSNPSDGIGNIIDIWVLDPGKTIDTSDGNGHLHPTSFVMPQNQWVKLRVVFNQDNRTYNLFAQPDGGSETQLRADAPLVAGSAKFGAPGYEGVVSAASINCTYFL